MKCGSQVERRIGASRLQRSELAGHGTIVSRQGGARKLSAKAVAMPPRCPCDRAPLRFVDCLAHRSYLRFPANSVTDCVSNDLLAVQVDQKLLLSNRNAAVLQLIRRDVCFCIVVDHQSVTQIYVFYQILERIFSPWNTLDTLGET